MPEFSHIDISSSASAPQLDAAPEHEGFTISLFNFVLAHAVWARTLTA